MKRINNIMQYLDNHSKVISADKNTYTLENGDIIEHQFELPDNITVEEFQFLLDNAKNTLNNLINNVTDNE